MSEVAPEPVRTVEGLPGGAELLEDGVVLPAQLVLLRRDPFADLLLPGIGGRGGEGEAGGSSAQQDSESDKNERETVPTQFLLGFTLDIAPPLPASSLLPRTTRMSRVGSARQDSTQ